jgi:hypothetical protein
VLLERVGSEAAARGNVPMDYERLVARRHHVDAGADSGAVGLFAEQLDVQPFVSLAEVLEQDVVIAVASHRAAHLHEQVHTAVAVPVAAGDAVALLEVARSRRRLPTAAESRQDHDCN